MIFDNCPFCNEELKTYVEKVRVLRNNSTYYNYECWCRSVKHYFFCFEASNRITTITFSDNNIFYYEKIFPSTYDYVSIYYNNVDLKLIKMKIPNDLFPNKIISSSDLDIIDVCKKLNALKVLI